MTDDEIKRRLDDRPARVGPYALAVRYSPSRDEIVLVLDTNVTLAIPRAAVHELRAVPKSQLKHVELLPGGDAVAVETADVHISVQGLVRDTIGLDKVRPVTQREKRPKVQTAARKRRPSRAA